MMRATAILAFFSADVFGQLAAPAFERRTSPTTVSRTFAASNR